VLAKRNAGLTTAGYKVIDSKTKAVSTLTRAHIAIGIRTSVWFNSNYISSKLNLVARWRSGYGVGLVNTEH